MSAYSDWKSGAITDEEYRQISQRENRKARMDAKRAESAFLDQYQYGRCMDGEYYKDDD